MSIHVLFFGELGDTAQRSLGSASFNVDANETNDTLSKLQEIFADKDTALADIFKRNEHLCAVNQEIQRQNLDLNDGDEVAFMSPFSGG